MPQYRDAIIVGGGPAGASCAIWLARLGLAPLLVEADARLGGLPNDNPFADDWIATLPGVTGQQVGANIARSVEAAGVPVLRGHRAVAVARADEGYKVTVQAVSAAGRTVREKDQGGSQGAGAASSGGSDGLAAARSAEGAEDASTILFGRHLVIASGVRARNLAGAAPGDRWPGVLVGPGSAIVEQDYAGLSVAILGGGDNGFENYAYVKRRGARTVHLYARGVRARPQLVDAVPAADLRVGSYRVDPVARHVDGHPYDLLLVLYGWEPQADFAAGLDLRRDERGYIHTDFATARASAEGVYAIGEVANRMHPCVVTSMADGVVAAKAIQAALQR
ncbi:MULTISPECIES: NAD(P)/FAD-dependent oxidoreductase [unclassified Achromobacter]|uniref:NAD(P)/FAD-dependent oxidoreductase n=1 Tax=unclassified Achromobacter TaxID=2626865 RepID=UPI000B51D3CD|nr:MULTISPECIES: NAD(P)/FAD-dependent oxidoreductase [unclassified Achromobacter]OWT75724.1 oxidoreductase [Achromobacter sp. HZ28]OWT76385.1 oxidoreductase [Achromobacter sp. HZ34]